MIDTIYSTLDPQSMDNIQQNADIYKKVVRIELYSDLFQAVLVYKSCGPAKCQYCMMVFRNLK